MSQTQTIKKTTKVINKTKPAKKDTNEILKRYLFPIAISTAGLYFIWIILDWVSLILNDNYAMFEGLRYAGIIITILALVVMGLFLAYSTLECFKFKKSMMKENLSTLIFNILVSFALLVLFLLVAVRVCQKTVWNGEELYVGTTFAVNGRLMGATFVLITYVGIYLATQMRTKQLNNNVKMIKSIIWTMTVTVALSLFLMIFRIIGGFFSFEKIFEAEVFARLANGAVRAGNIAITMFGLSTILVIIIIPLLFLIEKNEELIKRQILISALIGGISFILFVVTLAVMNEKVIKFVEQKTGTTVCTVLLLVNFAATILFTVFSFINNKKFFGLYIDLTFKSKKQKTKKVEVKETKDEQKEEVVKPTEDEKIEIKTSTKQVVETTQEPEIDEEELEVVEAQEVETSNEQEHHDEAVSVSIDEAKLELEKPEESFAEQQLNETFDNIVKSDNIDEVVKEAPIEEAKTQEEKETIVELQEMAKTEPEPSEQAKPIIIESDSQNEGVEKTINDQLDDSKNTEEIWTEEAKQEELRILPSETEVTENPIFANPNTEENKHTDTNILNNSDKPEEEQK